MSELRKRAEQTSAERERERKRIEEQIPVVVAMERRNRTYRRGEDRRGEERRGEDSV